MQNLFFVLSQKVLIVERRSNAVSVDINKVLLIKISFTKIKAYLTLRAILYSSALVFLSMLFLFFARTLKTRSMMA